MRNQNCVQDHSQPTDLELAERIAGNDRNAFNTLVDRYRRKALSVACRILKNRHDAEDLTQEAFIKVYQNIAKFEGKSSFYTWFYRILVNACLDHLRRHKIQYTLIREEDDTDSQDNGVSIPGLSAPGDTPDVAAVKMEEYRAVLSALDELSPRQKLVFQLKHQDGFKITEIAEITGQTEGSVKTHLFRALEKLKTVLTERGEGL